MANLCYCSTCWPGGYRADGTEYRAVLAGHVMIRMHLDGAPVGDLVGLPVPGGERLPLLVKEHDQGLTRGGAGYTASGNVAHQWATCSLTSVR